jgi:hypothetical protein
VWGGVGKGGECNVNVSTRKGGGEMQTDRCVLTCFKTYKRDI